MTQEVARKTRSAQCVHHWVIEAPNGRESRGRCKHCNKAKVFANSTEHVMWEQTNTLRNDLRSALRIPKPRDVSLAEEQ